MNWTAFFQKHNSCIFSVIERWFIKLFVRGNKRRIKWLRNGGARIGKGVVVHNIRIFGTEPWLIEVGDNCYFSGSEILLLTHDGGVGKLYDMNISKRRADCFGKIKIGNNCFIGARAIILKNVTIGNNCVIGAGTIVTKDIPDNSVACGVPARVIENIEEYYKKNKDSFSFTKDWSLYEKRQLHEKEMMTHRE